MTRQLFELFAILARHGDFGAAGIGHAKDVGAGKPRGDFGDVVEVDHKTFVDTGKTVFGEAGFELFDGEPDLELEVSGRLHIDLLPFRFKPQNIAVVDKLARLILLLPPHFG